MYEINSLSCLAIEYCLNNYSLVDKHIKQVKSSKKFLINELKKLNIDYIDTHANFFHIKFGQKSRTLENIFKKKEFYLEKDQELKDLKIIVDSV